MEEEEGGGGGFSLPKQHTPVSSVKQGGGLSAKTAHPSFICKARGGGGVGDSLCQNSTHIFSCKGGVYLCQHSTHQSQL